MQTSNNSVQTEFDATPDVLPNLELRGWLSNKDKSQEFASITYLLILGRVTDTFQRKEMIGDADWQEDFNPQEQLNAYSYGDLLRKAERMADKGLLEEKGGNQSYFQVTEDGETLLRFYATLIECIGEVNRNQAERDIATGEIIGNIELWNTEIREMGEEVMETVLERKKKVVLKSVARFFKSLNDSKTGEHELKKEIENIWAVFSVLEFNDYEEFANLPQEIIEEHNVRPDLESVDMDVEREKNSLFETFEEELG